MRQLSPEDDAFRGFLIQKNKQINNSSYRSQRFYTPATLCIFARIFPLAAPGLHGKVKGGGTYHFAASRDATGIALALCVLHGGEAHEI